MAEHEHRPYRTRTSVLFAAAAPKAVILRRGPRTHYHLVAWNMEDDTFGHGQWMKGNVQLCDLSPSGDKLIYFAEQLHASARYRAAGAYDPMRQRRVRKSVPRRPKRRTPRYLRVLGQTARPAAREIKGGWTAVSTPPYFSALALWPSIGRWTGGGMFLGEHDLVLCEPPDGLTPIENVPMPAALRVRSWQEADAAGQPSAYMPGVKESAEHARVAEVLRESGLLWVDWINLRHANDMLFAGDGRIFRLPGWRSVAEKEWLAAARQLADLRELSFQLVPAPSTALSW